MDGNLYSLLRSRFDKAMDRPVFAGADGGVVRYGELDELSARLAAVLAARGVAPGDRVAVQVEKSVAAVALYLACLRCGAVFVPLNTAYTDAEVDHVLRDAEPRILVSSLARQAAGRRCEILGTTPDSPLWAEALRTRPLEEVAARSPGDLAAIVYTSGTTGAAKGAMTSHGNLAANGRTLAELWGFRREDVLLHALPIYHVHGLFVALHCAMLGASTVLFLPKFDAAQVRGLLPRSTVMMGVPTFYTRLLSLPQFGREDCRSMRLFLSGSAPLLADTHREFEARSGHRILERYGMTETGMITSNPLDGERVAGTVGFALPDVEVRIIREDGSAAAVDEAGVLEVRGPNVFRGYWRLPEKSAREFRADGFFLTGDIATCDAAGRITLVGRAKDLIITGGLNVYPREIEELLDALPGVEESAVVGVPDKDFGEAIVAVIVRKSGSDIDEAAIMDAVRARLARFKHPRRVLFAGELPRNAMGKVQKKVLRERCVASAAAD